jgi:hypothetical protein
LNSIHCLSTVLAKPNATLSGRDASIASARSAGAGGSAGGKRVGVLRLLIIR